MVKRKTNPIDKMCWNMNIPTKFLPRFDLKFTTPEQMEQFNKNTKKSRKVSKEIGKYSEKLSQPRSIETHGIYYNKLTEKKARDRLNKKLNHISERYYANNIPWGIIMDAAISEGFEGAMLTNIDDNRPGKVHVNIGGDTWLTVMWYIMPESQKYEITAYVN